MTVPLLRRAEPFFGLGFNHRCASGVFERQAPFHAWGTEALLISKRSGPSHKAFGLACGTTQGASPRTWGISVTRSFCEPTWVKDTLLINNRQAGRRRGRGGQRPQGSGGNRDNGNRIDNRARGNAPQLLEKYKTLARDAQQQGDRVLTEYYLQFADHYFRVVAESRARFEESRPQRRDEWQSEDGDMQDGVEGETANDADDAQGYDGRGNERSSNRDRSEAREPREPREPRAPRSPRRDFNRDDESLDENRGNRAPRRNSRDDVLEGPGTGALPVDMLPPAIGVVDLPSFAADNDGEAVVEEVPAPRRRGRPARAKTEDAA
jgi:Domain of unknown function (DUF4167)